MSNLRAGVISQHSDLLTASPEKLVKLLYDGAIRNLEQSRAGLAAALAGDAPGGIESSGEPLEESLDKAIRIVGELRTSLDQAAGGQIARNLDRLYEYSLDQLSRSRATRAPDGVDHVLHVMRTLKDGWDAVIPE